MATVKVQGNIIRVSIGGLIPPSPPVDSVRGEIDSFSLRSRRRLLDTLNSLVFTAAVFSTYTYHRNVSSLAETAKDWNRFMTSVRRANLKGVWVREVQKRGAYHYHVLYLDTDADTVSKLDKHWYKVEENDKYHIKYGIKHQVVDVPARAVAYIAKYATKSQDEYKGRRWATFGSPAKATEIKVEIPNDMAEEWLKSLDGKVATYKSGHATRAVHYAGCLGRATPPLPEVISALANPISKGKCGA